MTKPKPGLLDEEEMARICMELYNQLITIMGIDDSDDEFLRASEYFYLCENLDLVAQGLITHSLAMRIELLSTIEPNKKVSQISAKCRSTWMERLNHCVFVAKLQQQRKGA